jgi:hypothetical protein
MNRGLAAAAAAWLALGATAAHAAQDVQESKKAAPCVTPVEAEAILTVLMPGLVRGVTTTCTPLLPAGAYLRERGTALAERFVGPAAASRAVAVAAASRIGGPEMQALTSNPSFDSFIDTMTAEMVKGKMKAQECAAASSIAEQLDPMPPGNFARLIVTIAELAMAEEKTPEFRICRVSAA